MYIMQDCNKINRRNGNQTKSSYYISVQTILCHKNELHYICENVRNNHTYIKTKRKKTFVTIGHHLQIYVQK